MAQETVEVQEIPEQWPLRAPHTPIPVLAHRGAVGPARENTLEAFAAALDAGADGVELDVRLSRSGTAVVHHDAEVPGLGPIGLLDDAELPPWMATLAEALGACAGRVVDVEIKGAAAGPGHDGGEQLAAGVSDLVAAALAGPRPPARAVVSSFWPGTLQAVRERRPELPTGLLVPPGVPADALGPAEELGAAMLLPFRADVDSTLVEAAHDRGLAVWTWTVNEEADLRSAAAAGVDGVITDRVPFALEVLRGAAAPR